MKIFRYRRGIAIFTILLACLGATSCSGEPMSAQKAFLEKINTYRIEADEKPPAEVFRIIDETMRGTAPYDPASDFSARAIAYTASLEKRSDDRDPTSAYYAGRNQSRMCRWMASHGREADDIARCWNRTISTLKIASEAGFGAASKQIAFLLAEDHPRKVSRPEAASWYVTAANQYLKAGDRNAASAAVRKALKQVPNYAAALYLQQTLTE